MAYDGVANRWEPQGPRKNPKIPIVWTQSDILRWPITRLHDIGNEAMEFFFGQSRRISEFGLYGILLYFLTGFTTAALLLMIVSGSFLTEFGVACASATLIAGYVYIQGIVCFSEKMMVCLRNGRAFRGAAVSFSRVTMT